MNQSTSELELDIEVVFPFKWTIFLFKVVDVKPQVSLKINFGTGWEEVVNFGSRFHLHIIFHLKIENKASENYIQETWDPYLFL